MDYNVEMKACENSTKFLEKVDEIKDTIGKPLQFQDINDEIESTYKHINEQKDMIKSSLENFKDYVFKIAV